MRKLEIVHRTHYLYAAPVTLGDHRLMFRPRDSHDLRLLGTSLAIEPAAQVRWVHDAFGNSIAIASFDTQTESLEFVSRIQVERYGVSSDLPPIEDYARKLPFSYAAEEAPDLARYVERHYPDPNASVRTWARRFLNPDGESFATLERMCMGIQGSLSYAMRFEHGTQAPATTLETAGGTCRDYALLMMEGARALGVAARFVTGYLYDPALDCPRRERGVTAYPHAWMEAYLPGAGWIEFDPTNGIVGTERLIRVAVARDPEQAMPIKGTFVGEAGIGIQTTVDVEVRTLASRSGTEPEPAPIEAISTAA